MSAPVVVMDASAGVKWYRSERGSDRALELLAQHHAGGLRIAVPDIFVHEVLDVLRRHRGVEAARQQWRDWLAIDLVVVPLDDTLMEAAFGVSHEFGCTLYDAMAPALAGLIDAPWYSADARAHGGMPNVTIIG